MWFLIYCVGVTLKGPKGDRTKWYWTKWYGQNGTDKMVRTKWYGQNGSNFYRFQLNLIEFVFSNHKSQIIDEPKWV